MNEIYPGKLQRQPRNNSDIVIGAYYYGVHCPACAKTGPLIEEINENMIGARIEEVVTDDMWKNNKMKHKSLTSKFAPNVRGSFKHGAIEATPTIIWSDGLKTEGVPFGDDGDINESESSFYLCIRAAKCFMKETQPGMSIEEIEQTIEQVFEGRVIQTPHGLDPYKGLREITREI